VDPVAMRERTADESEWRDVWKQFFRATRVGRHFMVRPSWDPGQPAQGEFVIDLDPGRAFGTGAHPSTRMVIELAEHLHDQKCQVGRFLDLGCGSGILSIAATRLWPEALSVAVDNDAEATSCSEENFERNHVRGVTVVTGTLDDADGEFDLVLANIQADVLCELAAQMATKIVPGGHAILSGILLDQVDEVLGAYARAGLALDLRQDDGEWSGLLLRREATAS